MAQGDQYVPYMGGRLPRPLTDPLGYLVTDGVPEYNVAGNVDYVIGKLQGSDHMERATLFINGLTGGWGTIDHMPVLGMVETFPTPDNTYATEELLFAATPIEGNIGYATLENSYWIRWKGHHSSRIYWVRLQEYPTPAGTFVWNGSTYDILTISWPASEIVAAYNRSMETNYTRIPRGLYEICFAGNQRHYRSGTDNSYDALFYLTPNEPLHEDDYSERREVGKRFAVEKAQYEDEAVALNQLQAGFGIAIIVRPSDYEEEAEVFDLVFESLQEHGIGLTSGFSLTTGAITGSASTIYDRDTRLIFATDAEYILDDTGVRTGGITVSGFQSDPIDVPTDSIPIGFQRKMVGTVQTISARGLHSGVYPSHDNGTVRTFFEPTGVLRFVDNDDLLWTITEQYYPVDSDLGAGRGYRRGISIQGTINFPEAETGMWVLSDGTNNRDVENEGVVTVTGSNGVSATVSGTPPAHSLEINRPLEIQENGSAEGLPDTVVLNFDNTVTPDLGYTLVELKVDDIGGGERRVRAQVETPEFSTIKPRGSYQWWYDHYGPIFYPDSLGMYHGYSNPSSFPLGVFGMRDTDGNLVGNTETFAENLPAWSASPTFDPGYVSPDYTFQPGSGRRDPLLAQPKLLQINQDGWYHIQGEASGKILLDSSCSLRGAFFGKHFKRFSLIVKRGGQYYHSAPLGNWELQMLPINNIPNMTPAEASYVFYNSTPWFLHGDLNVWLEEDDEVGFFVLAGLTANGLPPNLQILTYQTFLFYHRMEIEQMQPEEIDVNTANGLHALSHFSPTHHYANRYH